MNVTLVSYTHLCFLLGNPIIGPLENLWKVGIDLQHTGSAQEYWAAIDSSVASISSAQPQALDEMKRLELEKIRELGAEGIAFWENRIERYQNLSKEEAVRMLIESQKIESRIQTIRRAIV